MTSPIDPQSRQSTKHPDAHENRSSNIDDPSNRDNQTHKRLDLNKVPTEEEALRPSKEANSSDSVAQETVEKPQQEQAASLHQHIHDPIPDKEQPLSREALRKKRLQEEQAMIKNKEKSQEKSRAANRKKEKKETRRLKVRLIPIWLRVLLILVLCGVALVGGTMVGYGIIGKGNPSDVFNMSMWTHIRDIIYAKN